MKLSQTIVYAIQAILHIAGGKPEVPISCGHLAAEAQLPERYLVDILRTLTAHRVLYSTRGVDGGFSLARSVDHITLRDLCEAFDFFNAPHVPAIEGQPLVVREQVLKTLQDASSAALAETQKLTLGELLRGCQINGTTLAGKPQPTPQSTPRQGANHS